MAKTFFFYDLETSGLNPRQDRIMQFAGQRTDLDLNPVGEPINELVRLNDDTLPSPGAIMVTGITPQATISDGYSEAEFAKILNDQVFTENTIAVGFNNIRFDDEFVRHLFWRNFHDPYEWSWRDGRSRWDLLDVVRMMRALRPEGLNWPVTEEGKATNRLELLAEVNKIDHIKAHDALSDVEALIALTRLIKQAQPKLYEYLLSLRNKNDVKRLVNLDDKQPFVYASGRYEEQFHKATVAFPLAPAPHGNVLVYDLRHDPSSLVESSAAELEKRLFASWQEKQEDGFQPVPVKTLAYNRAPAVAPLGVLESSDGWQRLGLSLETIKKHQAILLKAPHFAENLRTAFEARPEFAPQTDVEAQLYDGFISDRDKLRVEAVRNASAKELVDFNPEFSDERLGPLLLRYKARNYPETLSASEQATWQEWRSARISSRLASYSEELAKLQVGADDDKQFLIDELLLWAESIIDQ